MEVGGVFMDSKTSLLGRKWALGSLVYGMGIVLASASASVEMRHAPREPAAASAASGMTSGQEEGGASQLAVRTSDQRSRAGLNEDLFGSFRNPRSAF